MAAAAVMFLVYSLNADHAHPIDCRSIHFWNDNWLMMPSIVHYLVWPFDCSYWHMVNAVVVRLDMETIVDFGTVNLVLRTVNLVKLD